MKFHVNDYSETIPRLYTTWIRTRKYTYIYIYSYKKKNVRLKFLSASLESSLERGAASERKLTQSSYLGGLGVGRCSSSRLSHQPGRRQFDGVWWWMYRLRRDLAQDSGYATRMAGQGGSQGRPPGSWNPGSVCSAEELPSPSPRPYRSGPILIGFMHGVKKESETSASSSWPRYIVRPSCRITSSISFIVLTFVQSRLGQVWSSSNRIVILSRHVSYFSYLFRCLV